MIPQIDQMRAEELLAIVRILDDAMNNTSLILLFEVGGKLLAVPRRRPDRELALRPVRERPTPPRSAPARGADVYKVGHHGSLNATPKSLWNAFDAAQRGGDADRLMTLVSTLSGKHGSVARKTEVPRKVLIDELKRLSSLSNTQTLRSRKQFWVDVDIDL